MKNNPTLFQQAQKTIPSEIRDFPEWHHGRKNYAVWVLLCDDNEALQEKFNAARQHLNSYLLEPYHRQPHITLFVCGFLSDEYRYNDDFTYGQYESQLQVLKEANIEPFEIEVGGMNSFASAPFLEVSDPDEGILRLREILSKGANEFRTTSYRPHLTIGLYAEAFSSEKILKQMEVFVSKPVRLKVKQMALVSYKSHEIAGELSHEYIYRFEANSKKSNELNI
ncbi:MAG: 2'-5' RNA ligase family protein [Gammaproteobacteria bacterium]|nr:2'-5' RNA ligase family protein [Gammaproteobacteria bacterium]